MGLKDRWRWGFLRPVFHCWCWYYDHFDEYYYQNTWLWAYYWVLIMGVECAKDSLLLCCHYIICTVPINHVGFQKPVISNMHSSESIVSIAVNYLKVHSFVHKNILEYDRFIHLKVIQWDDACYTLVFDFSCDTAINNEMHEITSQHTLRHKINSNRW